MGKKQLKSGGSFVYAEELESRHLMSSVSGSEFFGFTSVGSESDLQLLHKGAAEAEETQTIVSNTSTSFGSSIEEDETLTSAITGQRTLKQFFLQSSLGEEFFLDEVDTSVEINGVMTPTQRATYSPALLQYPASVPDPGELPYNTSTNETVVNLTTDPATTTTEIETDKLQQFFSLQTNIKVPAGDFNVDEVEVTISHTTTAGKPIDSETSYFYISTDEGLVEEKSADDASAIELVSLHKSDAGSKVPQVSNAGQLSAAIVRSTTPPSVVDRSRVQGAIKVAVTDVDASTQTGRAEVDIYAAPTGTLGPTSILVATAKPRFLLRPGETVNVKLPINHRLPDGTYTLLATVGDVTGVVQVSPSGPIVTSAPPYLTLHGSVVSVFPAAAFPSQTLEIQLTLTDLGNRSVSGAFTFSIGLSTSVTTLPRPLETLRKDVSVKSLRKPVIVTLHIQIPSSQAEGTYVPFVSVIFRAIDLTAVANTTLNVG